MKTFRTLLLAFFLIIMSHQANAQCSMCRAVAQSNMNSDGRKVGVGLNKGILYLMAVPYLMGGIGFWIWFRNRKSPAA